MPLWNRLFVSLILPVLLLSCGSPAPSGGGAVGPVPSVKVEQGNGVLFRKSKRYQPFADTTVILLDSANRIRVDDVVFQGPDFNRLLVNQWEAVYMADSVLPSAFRLQSQKGMSPAHRESISSAIARAQDTVRAFVMKRENLDRTAADRKYPVLAQPAPPQD